MNTNYESLLANASPDTKRLNARAMTPAEATKTPRGKSRRVSISPPPKGLICGEPSLCSATAQEQRTTMDLSTTVVAPIRVLAIDPSIAKCGWGVVDYAKPPTVLRYDNGRAIVLDHVASGVWSPSDAKAAPDRFDQLAAFIAGLITQHRPGTVVVETPATKMFRGAKWSVDSRISYGRAIGVIEATAYMSGVDLVRVGVNEWKGRGSKGATMRHVSAIFRYEPRDHNEADALGLALFGASQHFPRTK